MRARADLRRPSSVVVAAAEVSASANASSDDERGGGFGAFGFGGLRAAADASLLLLLDDFLEPPPPPLEREKEKPRAVGCFGVVIVVVEVEEIFLLGKEEKNCEVVVESASLFLEKIKGACGGKSGETRGKKRLRRKKEKSFALAPCELKGKKASLSLSLVACRSPEGAFFVPFFS